MWGYPHEEESWPRFSGLHRHSCQVKDDGTIRCWGPDYNGELGDNPSLSQSCLQVGWYRSPLDLRAMGGRLPIVDTFRTFAVQVAL
jgi:hypothetical protein